MIAVTSFIRDSRLRYSGSASERLKGWVRKCTFRATDIVAANPLYPLTNRSPPPAGALFSGAPNSGLPKNGASLAGRVAPGVLALLAAATAPAAEVRIRHVDRVIPVEALQGVAGGAPVAGSTSVRIDLPARRLELLLSPNRALQPAGAPLGGALAYRGTVAGLSGSWVRVTRQGTALVGVVFDGAEYLALDTAAGIAGSADGAVAMPPGAQVVYRLADVQVTGPLFEGDQILPRDGLAAADGLLAEIAPPTASAVLPTRRLAVGVIVDDAQVSRDGGATAARDRALARLNVADGVFAAQAGVQLRLGSYTHETGTTTFSAADASALLDQVSSYRVASATERANGVTHLITGRDLTGNTVGIAFLGAVCSSTFGASLSEGRNTLTFDGLILAHEFGHVFGAPHDGEAACAAGPSAGFLMAPQFNGSQTFSDCSLTQIQAKVAAARCLAPVDAADGAVSASTADAALNQATPVSFTVSSLGSAALTGASVTASLPVSMTVESASVPGGSCSVTTPQQATCTLGDLAPDERRAIRLVVASRITGSATVRLALTATNDGLSTNNGLNWTVRTAPGSDLRVGLAATPASIVTGGSSSIAVTLANAGLAATMDARLTLTLPAGLTATAVSGGNPACTLTAGAVDCPAGAIGVDATSTVTVSVTGSTVGAQRVTATLQSSLTDPQPANNEAAVVVEVTAPAPVVQPPPATPAPVSPAASGSSGGGGGRSDAVLLALLALALGFRSRPRQSAAPVTRAR
jgi:hypothetical protein